MNLEISSRARSFSRDQVSPPRGGTSRKNGLPAESKVTEWALFWALVAGLVWCPFLFGSNVLLAWGIGTAAAKNLAHALGLYNAPWLARAGHTLCEYR